VCSGQLPLKGLTIEAKEEVITTRLTLGADFLIDFRMPVVPIMAGSRSSFEVVSWLIGFGDHWLSTYLLDIGHVEVEWAGSMDYGLEWRIRHHGLVESILLGDVFDNGKVELV
jgi:hypothetical protein